MFSEQLQLRRSSAKVVEDMTVILSRLVNESRENISLGLRGGNQQGLLIK